LTKVYLRSSDGSGFQPESLPDGKAGLINNYSFSAGSTNNDEVNPDNLTILTLFPDGWLAVPGLTPDPFILTADEPAHSLTCFPTS